MKTVLLKRSDIDPMSRSFIINFLTLRIFHKQGKVYCEDFVNREYIQCINYHQTFKSYTLSNQCTQAHTYLLKLTFPTFSKPNFFYYLFLSKVQRYPTHDPLTGTSHHPILYSVNKCTACTCTYHWSRDIRGVYLLGL